jgi:hypothetical protein
MGTYDPKTKNEKCQLVTIHRLTHKSQNCAFTYGVNTRIVSRTRSNKCLTPRIVSRTRSNKCNEKLMLGAKSVITTT